MTLTELSYYSRKALPFLIIFFLLFLIIFYLFKLFFLYLELNRPKKISINPVFGKINKPLINESIDKKFSYTLDTIEGEPISASESAKVYFIPPTQAKLSYRERIYLIAKNFGINTELTRHKLFNNEAIFEDEQQTLKIDITNYNFNYQYNLSGEEEFLINNIIPSKEQIESKAIDFLKDVGRYPDEFSQGKINIIYLKFDSLTKTLTIVEQPGQANLIEIDFYRPDIDGFPVVSTTYFNSQNYLVMVFDSNSSKVIKAQIRFYEKSDQEFGIYPVKNGNQAWEELTQNKGIIVSAPENTDKITIKKMFFAYLDPNVYQEYFQPVYVFLGSNNFAAYVPAISNDYLGN